MLEWGSALEVQQCALKVNRLFVGVLTYYSGSGRGLVVRVLDAELDRGFDPNNIQ